MELFKNLFGEPEAPETETIPDEDDELHFEAKKAALEKVLGPMYEIVGHSALPFALGGAVDMYFFPNVMNGTVMVTMELIEPDGSGPAPNRMGTYELAACTRYPVNEPNPSFEKIERRFNEIFTTLGNYSYEATLEPGETCEIPAEDGGTICLLLDELEADDFVIAGRKHGLLLCMEIFRSEMEFAKKNGSEELIAKLKHSGYYPYSDMERVAVVG